jgi:hypothetical protein
MTRLHSACHPHSLLQAIIHKDSVYVMDTRAIDGRAPPTLDKVALPEPLSPVTQASGECDVAAGRRDRCAAPGESSAMR